MYSGEHESGFRRLPSYRKALLAAEVACLCGDLPEAWVSPTVEDEEPQEIKTARGYIPALKAIAGKLATITRERQSFLDLAAPDVRFAAGGDVADPETRLLAIVARAYARADEVAWSEAAGEEDDRELEAFARRVNTFLPHLEQFRSFGRHALVRRRYAAEEERQRWHECAERALEDLTALAELAGRTSSANSAPGRRREVARKFFVLRLAGVYALITGAKPPLSGGNVGAKHDERGSNKRAPNPWHDLINAAIDLTDIRANATTDSILQAAAAERAGASKIEDLANGEWSQGSGRWRLEYHRLPGADIENEVGLTSGGPMSREEAYADPGANYAGRTGEG